MVSVQNRRCSQVTRDSARRGVLHLLLGHKQVAAFSGSAGKVLEILIEKKVMTPTQLAQSLATSTAAVLYSLRTLMNKGIVQSIPC